MSTPTPPTPTEGAPDSTQRQDSSQMLSLFTELERDRIPFDLPGFERTNAHTLNPGKLLGGTIELDRLPLVDNRFSQTPGDPVGAVTGSGTYRMVGLVQMEKRLFQGASAVGLIDNDRVLDVAEMEIGVQHEKRCDESAASYSRLKSFVRDNKITRFSEHEANLLWWHRTGQATPSEEAEVLLTYPVLGSVEAAKRTAPFKPEAMEELDDYMTVELLKVRERLLNLGLDATISLFPKNRLDLTRPKFRNHFVPIMDGNGGKMYDVCVPVRRQAVASIHVEPIVEGMVEPHEYPDIILKRKVSYEGLPVEHKIGNTRPNIEEIDGIEYDLQFLGGNYYWALADKDRSIGTQTLRSSTYT